MQIGMIISTTVLAILLIVCLTVSSTVIVIAQLKIQAELEEANRALADLNKLKSSGLSMKQLNVDTSDNIAYSKSSGLPFRRNWMLILEIMLLPQDQMNYITIKQRDVDISDNVAYGVHVIG